MATVEETLPDDVLAAIHQGRKVEAIKLLREQRGLGLAEAKRAVDSYSAENRDRISERHHMGDNQPLRWLLVTGLLAAAGYALYNMV